MHLCDVKGSMRERAEENKRDSIVDKPRGLRNKCVQLGLLDDWQCDAAEDNLVAKAMTEALVTRTQYIIKPWIRDGSNRNTLIGLSKVI